MWEKRALSPDEGLLRHSSGSTDLTKHDGWYSLTPRAKAERLTIFNLDVLIAGPGLLSHIERFSGSTAHLELELHRETRYRSVHDAVGTTLHTIEAAGEWREGTHQGTIVDPNAGMLPDGSSRAGLRGVDAVSFQTTPAVSATWTSAPIELRSGHNVERVAWTVDDLRDASGTALRAFTISFRLGKRTGAGITWKAWQVVSSTDGQSEAALTGTSSYTAEYAQWKVELTYSPASGVGYDHHNARRTPIVYSLGFWLKLPSHLWRFESVAELLARAAGQPQLLPKGYGGNLDAVVLSLPLGVELAGDPGEFIRARFTAQASSAPPTILQIRAIGNVTSVSA